MTHIINSKFYGDGWSTQKSKSIFSDDTRFQRWLDFWSHLAIVQAQYDEIPAEAAKIISENARIEKLDKEFIKDQLNTTGHSLMPLLKALQKECGEHGQFIHMGPTTQDVEDTGTILEIKDMFNIICQELLKLENKLIELSNKYKKLPMTGRTHNQHALVITLGLKFAGWADENRRNLERLKRIKKSLFVGMLHGGTGTMAGLGKNGMAIAEEVMMRLGLHFPSIGWSTSRDRIAEFTSLTGIIAGSISKIANEIYVLSRTEIGELHEPLPNNYIGSSTMPHKKNAECSEFIVMLGKIMRTNVGLAMEAMVSSGERDTRMWRLDWYYIPTNSMILARMLESINFLVGNLRVFGDKIKENMDLSGGWMLSEALMFKLGKKIGKVNAHGIIKDLAFKNPGKPLKKVLEESKIIMEHLSLKEIEEILDYNNHLGFAEHLVEKTVDSIKGLQSTNNDLLDTQI